MKNSNNFYNLNYIKYNLLINIMIIYLIPDDYNPGNKFKLELDYSKINYKDIKYLKFIIYCIPESYDEIHKLYFKYNSKKINLKEYIYFDKEPKIIKKFWRGRPKKFL